MPIDPNYTGKYRPVTSREDKAADPDGKARKAEEDRVLKEHLANASAATPAAPDGYIDRVKPLLEKVDSQIVKDRGPKHTRA